MAHSLPPRPPSPRRGQGGARFFAQTASSITVTGGSGRHANASHPNLAAAVSHKTRLHDILAFHMLNPAGAREYVNKSSFSYAGVDFRGVDFHTPEIRFILSKSGCNSLAATFVPGRKYHGAMAYRHSKKRE